jgi:hypothetical protein
LRSLNLITPFNCSFSMLTRNRDFMINIFKIFQDYIFYLLTMQHMNDFNLWHAINNLNWLVHLSIWAKPWSFREHFKRSTDWIANSVCRPWSVGTSRGSWVWILATSHDLPHLFVNQLMRYQNVIQGWRIKKKV